MVAPELFPRGNFYLKYSAAYKMSEKIYNVLVYDWIFEREM